MSAPDLARSEDRLREADRGLLRALAARAAWPREPWPPRGGGDPLLAPPLAELIYAAAPAGAAPDPAGAARANRDLVAALETLRGCAAARSEARFHQQRPASQAALEIGDRERMAVVLADLAADLRRLDAVRAAAAEVAPLLPDETVGLLWREHVIPWTHRIGIAHLMDPAP